LINETLAKPIGHKNPIGKQISLADFPPGVIVGVVNNFNYSSLYTNIEPLIISGGDQFPAIVAGQVLVFVVLRQGLWQVCIQRLVKADQPLVNQLHNEISEQCLRK
jgi:hypothetical protein